ncbi:Uncharacterized protein SCF082_LOCUS52875 [Durusdinium trenchii]|uniref:Uncharacterized protein n=1 Tax=Durusdinium trenchii TaxID=1381693 RepID=A0ABP0SP01_9DINO
MELPFASHRWECCQRAGATRGDFHSGWAQGETVLRSKSPCLELEELRSPLRLRLRRRLLVLNDTVCYRRLAKSHATKADSVLEIGSSLGECTAVLSSHAAAVLGIEVSEALVEESRQRFPALSFEWLDCFQEPERLQRYCEQLRCSGDLKLWLDIGGDRSSEDVLRLLSGLVEPPPVLVVVKCQQLVQDLADHVALDGTVTKTLIERGPVVKSARQVKKKLARARRAQWQQADSNSWQSFEKTRFLWDALSEEERRRIKDKRREGLGGWEIISVLVGGFLVLQGERLQGVRFQGD